jgi:hypothetical protein
MSDFPGLSNGSQSSSPAVAEWCTRIKSIQEARSPEAVEDYKRRAELVKRSALSATAASRMHRGMALSSASTCQALLCREEDGWLVAQERHAREQRFFSRLPSDSSEENDEEAAALVSGMQTSFAVTSPVLAQALAENASPDAVFDAAATELTTLLEKFADEPTSDEERDAKFKLYEAFANSSMICL